jgi:hypothetical protein
MRKKLVIRFVLAYFILSMCTPLLTNSIYYVQKFSYYNSGVPSVTSLPNDAYSLLVDYFQDFGMRLRSILMPSVNGYWLAVLVLTVGIAVAGAAIFANGIAKQYQQLYDRVEQIENGEQVTVKAEGELFSELEERLGNLARKSATEARPAMLPKVNGVTQARRRKHCLYRRGHK